MNELEQGASEKVSVNRLLIPAVVVGSMSVNVTVSIGLLFLVDIGSTFNVSVGVASQLSTVIGAAELISGLVMGALVVRFRYKPLILLGILTVILSSVGCYLAPNFVTLQVFSAIEGFGTIMFSVIAYTLIGDTFVRQRRAKAVSYVAAAGYVTAIISFPLSGFLANIAGWRSNYILQTLPIAFVGLALILLTVSPTLRKQAQASEAPSIVKSFKQVLKDKSAAAVLVSVILSGAGSMFSIFVNPFLRQTFFVSLDFTVVLLMITFAIFIFTSLASGRLVSKFGAKPVLVLSSLFCGVSTMSFFFIPILWVALIFALLMASFAGVAMTAGTCLALAQVPESRGTMVSLKSALHSIGTIIGPAVGGSVLVLTLGFYGSVGLALGGLLLASAAVAFFWAKEIDKA